MYRSTIDNEQLKKYLIGKNKDQLTDTEKKLLFEFKALEEALKNSYSTRTLFRDIHKDIERLKKELPNETLQNIEDPKREVQLSEDPSEEKREVQQLTEELATVKQLLTDYETRIRNIRLLTQPP